MSQVKEVKSFADLVKANIPPSQSKVTDKSIKKPAFSKKSKPTSPPNTPAAKPQDIIQNTQPQPKDTPINDVKENDNTPVQEPDSEKPLVNIWKVRLSQTEVESDAKPKDILNSQEGILVDSGSAERVSSINSKQNIPDPIAKKTEEKNMENTTPSLDTERNTRSQGNSTSPGTRFKASNPTNTLNVSPPASSANSPTNSTSSKKNNFQYKNNRAGSRSPHQFSASPTNSGSRQKGFQAGIQYPFANEASYKARPQNMAGHQNREYLGNGEYLINSTNAKSQIVPAIVPYPVYPVMAPVFVDRETIRPYILAQVEYYFSVENLCKDIFFRKQMDLEGYVPISVLANFNRVKSLTQEMDLIKETLSQSTVLEINGEMVRKKDNWSQWIIPPEVAPVREAN